MKKLLKKRTELIKPILIIMAMGNNALALFGKSPLPFSDVELEAFISSGITGLAVLTAWFHKNFPQDKTKEEV